MKVNVRDMYFKAYVHRYIDETVTKVGSEED